PKPAGGFNAAYEAEFARLINGYRSSHGLAPLARHSGLDSYARNWAEYMADNNKFGHSDISQLQSQGWGFAAENIGRGGSVKGIFDKLRSSAGHSDNMLRDVTHFGIGVYVDGDGRIWTAHVFAR
ncbi:MAG: CAP domain-containing protein, partial [Actinomycetes bacterium]